MDKERRTEKTQWLMHIDLGVRREECMRQLKQKRRDRHDFLIESSQAQRIMLTSLFLLACIGFVFVVANVALLGG